MYIVSACLLGDNCNYWGGNYNNDKVKDFLKDKQYISVCPEVMAGFSTPREVTEILNGRVITKLGEDVTEGYIRSAQLMWQAAMEKSAECGEEIEGADHRRIWFLRRISEKKGYKTDDGRGFSG